MSLFQDALPLWQTFRLIWKTSESKQNTEVLVNKADRVVKLSCMPLLFLLCSKSPLSTVFELLLVDCQSTHATSKFLPTFFRNAFSQLDLDFLQNWLAAATANVWRRPFPTVQLSALQLVFGFLLEYLHKQLNRKMYMLFKFSITWTRLWYRLKKVNREPNIRLSGWQINLESRINL